MVPLPVEVISIPTTMGSVRSPEVVAETPFTYCIYVGKKVIAPNIAKPTTKDSTQHTVNTGLPNNRIGRMGSAARRSTATNAPSAATAPTNKPMIVGEPHGERVPPPRGARVSPA